MLTARAIKRAEIRTIEALLAVWSTVPGQNRVSGRDGMNRNKYGSK
jgi:hypothetical protein